MPGPAPAYQPRFTKEQLDTIKIMARSRKAAYAVVQRAKLALLLHEQSDLDNHRAAQLLGQHENWVRHWRKRWVTEGFTLEERPGRGRKPRFPPSGSRPGEGMRV